MTSQGVFLTKCSFCAHSYVHFNIVAFEAWCSRQEGGDILSNLADVADQETILFQSDSSADGPCEHLVQLSLNLACGVFEDEDWTTRAAVSFNLINPRIKKWDPGNGVITHMREHAPEDGEDQLDQLGVENQFDEISVSEISMYPRSDGDLRFDALGTVVHAEDVHAFFEELRLEKEAAWGAA